MSTSGIEISLICFKIIFMKIRTVTSFINLNGKRDEEKIKAAHVLNSRIAAMLFERGFEVQSIRIATNPFGEYAGKSRASVLSSMSAIADVCRENEIDFFSVGCARNEQEIELIPEIISFNSMFFASALISDRNEILYGNLKAASQAVKEMGHIDVMSNFRFCSSAYPTPEIPFFPASYSSETEGFAIGCENGEVLNKTFNRQRTDLENMDALKDIFFKKYKEIERAAKQISKSTGFPYIGTDTSVVPGVSKDSSIAFAYEKMGFGNFGKMSTLHLSSLMTSLTKSIPVRRTGFCGLMLPLCEDEGLAMRSDEETYNLSNLLLYSSVCGCGLDTIPIPGNTSEKVISSILKDVAAIAVKLRKPLMARLLPIKKHSAGERTDFESQYLVNCKILDV